MRRLIDYFYRQRCPQLCQNIDMFRQNFHPYYRLRNQANLYYREIWVPLILIPAFPLPILSVTWLITLIPPQHVALPRQLLHQTLEFQEGEAAQDVLDRETGGLDELLQLQRLRAQ